MTGRLFSTSAGCLVATLLLYSAGVVASDTTDDKPLPSQILNYTTSEAGNPFVDGWYADPDTAIYEGQYWVFPTASYAYEEQIYLDAFSSPDLIHWTKHPNILTIKDVTWANKAVWAPAPVFRNGKYYIYFGANDLQETEALEGLIGGIGVAVSDRPEGPYVDAIGKPLIGNYSNGAQPIDQDVFIDDEDGQAYIYYGGHNFANVAKLNEDMISLSQFEDGTTFKEITPINYVEGPQMLKRGGKYYLMWSEGGWTGPDYAVSYAMADSPLGPFLGVNGTRILQQDSAVARGSGHNGVIHIPNTDIYYIIYHRRPLSETDGNHRVLCYDRMYFNEDGTIQPIHMLVKDNFADGDLVGWKIYGEQGDARAIDSKLEITSNTEDGVVAALDTNFADQIFDAIVTLPNGIISTTANAGIVFRVSNITLGATKAKGYYVGLSTAGKLFFKRLNGDGAETTILAEHVTVSLGFDHHVRVEAVGQSFSIFFDESPVMQLDDAAYMHGTNGLVSFDGIARFGNVSISEVN